MIDPDKLRALHDKATPGPWEVRDDPEHAPAKNIICDGWDIATAWGGYSAAE